MNIYITLDYELFVNDNTGDIEHCLIIPSDKFMDVCDKFNIKSTFYVDAAYLYRLNELKSKYESLMCDFNLVSQHVKDIVRRGHKVALHIHPQWYYAQYIGEQWQMDFEHYKLSDMPQDRADDLLVKSMNLLKDITGRPIDSFRAGGYSIQDYISFPRLFVENGIGKDSSVLCGEKLISSLHVFDYTNVKTGKCYSFKDDITKPAEDGCMIEFPISTFKMPFLEYCRARIKNNRTPNNVTWGNGGDKPAKKGVTFIRHFVSKLIKGVNCIATFDYPNCYEMDYWSKFIDNNTIDDLVIITHPKLLSPLSITNLERFLEKYHKTHTFNTI